MGYGRMMTLRATMRWLVNRSPRNARPTTFIGAEVA
jgi:hypothetical protein